MLARPELDLEGLSVRAPPRALPSPGRKDDPLWKPASPFGLEHQANRPSVASWHPVWPQEGPEGPAGKVPTSGPPAAPGCKEEGAGKNCPRPSSEPSKGKEAGQ